ncbi:MAG: hypothetical protein NTZ65_04765 [Candidatus Berkelbacteria bacterium]|nr:hypothetical protein [Candidatus Berkelbacteria bacterium]
MINIIEKDGFGRPTVLSQQTKDGSIRWEIAYLPESESAKAIALITRITTSEKYRLNERFDSGGLPLSEDRYYIDQLDHPFYHKGYHYPHPSEKDQRVRVEVVEFGGRHEFRTPKRNISQKNFGLLYRIIDEAKRYAETGKTRAEIYTEQTEGKHSDTPKDTSPSIEPEPTNPGLPRN